MNTSRWIRSIIYLAASCFTVYAIGTAAAFHPSFDMLTGTEQFAVAKHLLVVLALAVFLVYKPKLGSIAAAVWGVAVPFEKYLLLLSDLSSGKFLHSEVFTPSDAARLLVLFLGTCFSVWLAVKFNAQKQQQSQGG